MPSEADGANEKIWARPVIHVRDLARSVRYYCEKLGFEKDWEDDSGNSPAVAQVSRNGVALILDSASYFPKASIPSVVSLTLNDAPSRPGLEAAHRQIMAAGGIVEKAPFKVGWDLHVHQMDVEDPDGNVLMFWGHMPDAG